jgi:hypothetical protein
MTNELDHVDLTDKESALMLSDDELAEIYRRQAVENAQSDLHLCEQCWEKLENRWLTDEQIGFSPGLMKRDGEITFEDKTDGFSS